MTGRRQVALGLAQLVAQLLDSRAQLRRDCGLRAQAQVKKPRRTISPRSASRPAAPQRAQAPLAAGQDAGDRAQHGATITRLMSCTLRKQLRPYRPERDREAQLSPATSAKPRSQGWARSGGALWTPGGC